jgi:hypothetical protein
MEVSVAVATVKPVFPLTVSKVAVMVMAVLVSASAVTTPPGELMEACAVFDEVHVAVAVRSWVELSL